LGAADFADEIGGQRDECARTAAEKHHFRTAGIKGSQNWPVRKPTWTQNSADTSVCQLPSINARLIWREKWKFRLKTSPQLLVHNAKEGRARPQSMEPKNQSTKHECSIASAGRRLATLLILLSALIGPLTMGSAAAQMIDLGTLPGGTNSYAWAVSNGQVVGEAGYDAAGDTHAFSWTAAGGMVDLGTLPGYPDSSATAVDNGLVAGTCNGEGASTSSTRAFSWTATGGMVDLGTLPGFTDSVAEAVSDGQVVGWADTAAGITGKTHAFSWTAAGGMIDLGSLPGLSRSFALAVSKGQVVGYATNNRRYRAFSWTAAGGMIDLGTLPGGSSSIAYAVNNGQVVGFAYTAANYPHAFSWTAAGGMVDLGTLPGYPYSRAQAVSNGQVVGYADDDNDNLAFSWTAAGGMVDLGSLGGGYSEAWAVGNGQVVGLAETASSDSYGEIYHPFLWTAAGGMVDLGALPEYPYGWANAISNGQVVGVVQESPDGNYHAFSWTAPGVTPTATPTPTPTATATPGVTLLPSTLDFGTVTVGQTSAPSSVTLNNGTEKKLTIRKTTIGKDFVVVSTTCSSTLEPGQSCDYSISFEPLKAGDKGESFKVFDSAINSPQNVELQGSGAP
jgi:probable HAF family extracellular repeat protein